MQVIRVSNENEYLYTTYIQKHPKSLFYYELKYRNLLKELLNCEDEYYMLIDRNEVKAILPMVYKDGKYGRVYNSLAYYGANGSILAENEIYYNKLLEKYNEVINYSSVSTYIENPLIIYSNKPKHDYISNRVCQISQFDNDTDMNDLSKLFTSNKRNDIRKAIKNDVIVEIDNSKKAKQFLLSTHVENMNALGGIPKDEKLFNTFYQIYIENKDYNIFIAKKDGEKIAALLIIYYNGITEYYTPVILNKYREYQPLAILIYEAMKYSVNKGYLQWNWGGNGISLDSVYNFKKRWGAEDYKYDYFIKLNNKEFLDLDINTILEEYTGFFTIPFTLLKKDQKMINNKLEIGKFPFYWRTTSITDNKVNFSTRMLDFSLIIDHKSGFFKQERTQELLNTIKEVYQLDHNIGYLQEGTDEVKTYGKEFYEFIVSAIEDITFDISKPFNILDIGCGGGIVLDQLNKKYENARAIGIEPSPLAKRASEKFGFELIEEFYPPNDREKVKNTTIVIHYDVLEHIEEPLIFLEDIFKDLEDEGLMFFSVPDCTAAIENGDISMLIHEHLNYFSVNSLSCITKQAGFNDVMVRQGEHGGTLLCLARKNGMKNDFKPNQKHFENDFDDFVLKNNKLLLKFKNIINENRDKSIGFYVPLRAIPYLAKLNLDIKVRFFDDSKFFKHKYLDGFEGILIESFEELRNDPSDIIFIMTYPYGDLIKKKIVESGISSKFYLLKNLCQE